jgi:hypothetical protein
VSTHDNLRVGDAERDAVASALREHFAQGRLTLDELQERLDAAFTARTRADLAPLTADLPATRPASPGPATDAGPRPYGPRRSGRPWLATWWFVPPWFLLLGIWALFAAGHGHPWLLVLLVLFVFVRFRARHHWRHHGPWRASGYGRGALRR